MSQNNKRRRLRKNTQLSPEQQQKKQQIQNISKNKQSKISKIIKYKDQISQNEQQASQDKKQNKSKKNKLIKNKKKKKKMNEQKIQKIQIQQKNMKQQSKVALEDISNDEQDQKKYNSSQKSDQQIQSKIMGIGFQKQKKKKQNKNDIRTKNKLFKGQLFTVDLQQKTQQIKNQEEQLKLEIPQKQYVKKSSTKIIQRAVDIRKNRGLGVNAEEQKKKTQQRCYKQIGQIMNNQQIQQNNQLEINLAVPRVNLGKHNKTLDNTLFLKKMVMKLKNQQQDVQSKGQKIRDKKQRFTRQSLLREFQNKVRTNKSQYLSKQDVMNTFATTTLQQIQLKNKKVDNQINKNQAQPNNEKQNLPQQVIQKQATQIIINMPKSQPLPLIQNQLKKKQSKKKKQKQIMKGFFQQQADESGNQQQIKVDKDSQNQQSKDTDLADLIDNQTEYNQQNQINALKKMREWEQKQDEQLIKNIMSGNFRSKKVKMPDFPQIQNQSRKQYMKKLLNSKDNQVQQQQKQQKQQSYLFNNQFTYKYMQQQKQEKQEIQDNNINQLKIVNNVPRTVSFVLQKKFQEIQQKCDKKTSSLFGFISNKNYKKRSSLLSLKEQGAGKISSFAPIQKKPNNHISILNTSSFDKIINTRKSGQYLKFN